MTKVFESERALCESFAEYIKPRGWEVHRETSDFDLLLVCREPGTNHLVQPGDIVGVQAKLRPSVEVLAQALPHWTKTRGPDFHMVLVPESRGDFKDVARALRIVVADYSKTSRLGERREWRLSHFYRHYYDKKPWYPDFVADVPAGVQSPRQITKWKIAAIRLCLLAEHRGWVTSLDFAKAGLFMDRWVQRTWLVCTGERAPDSSRHKKYVLNEQPALPHRKNPEVLAAVIERFGKTGGF